MAFLGKNISRKSAASNICPHCLKDITVPANPVETVSPQFMVNHIMAYDAPEHDLSDWEQEFIASINERLMAGKTLTEKQLAVVRDMYNDRC